MKAVLHYRAGPRLIETLTKHPPEGWDIVVVGEDQQEVFRSELADAEVLLHVLEPVGRTDMALAPNLKLIQKIGVGTDTIDLAAAEELGIGVANMPGSNSQAVAEMVLALIFAVLRRVADLDREVRAGNGWSLSPDRLERVGELRGRTVGLVGFGDIPHRLVGPLQALGARVIYHDLHIHAGYEAERRSLNDLLSEADIVSLHVPLTPATIGLIDATALSIMKDGAILINTARGALVDEQDLATALKCGKLLGAGLDVHVTEPVDPKNPLLGFDNVVMTPHVAWLTPETITRSLAVALANAQRAVRGETLLHEIKPALRGRNRWTN